MELSGQKIGVFGGTFNPIHIGHIRVGRDVMRGFGLEGIWLVPAAVPPHKKIDHVAPAEDRLAMTRAAAQGMPGFSVSDVELKRSGPSYSIDTLRHFQSILLPDSRLYFIVGMDAFLEIETWKSYRELFRVTPFVVMTRPGAEAGGDGKKWKRPCELLSEKVSSGYSFDPERNAFVHPDFRPVYLFEPAPVDVSATMIRRRVRQGRDIAGLVPEKVKEYIKAKGLYL